MRWTHAGAAYLVLILGLLAGRPTVARGQTPTGEVQSVGFNGYYRPDAWVPMVVRLKPASAEAGNYQVRVYQHDADGDRAVYVKPITVSGSTSAAEQQFWMYFLPDPTQKGLVTGGGSLHELQKELTAFLCDAKGKQLAQLPVTSTLENVDPYAEQLQGRPAHKLVVAVSANGGQQMPIGDLAVAIGLTQDMEIVTVRQRDLPTDPLGYDPIDAVVWLDGDPADLDAGGAPGLATLTEWVRSGGQLVVTQPLDAWQQVARGFADLLPVTVTGVGLKGDFEPLRSMAVPPDASDGTTAIDQWTRVRPPFRMARATAKPGAAVEQWVDWKHDGTDVTPYLARSAVGLGSVTWVAQPLTVESQPANAAGWPYVWLRVLGWRSDAFVPPPVPQGTEETPLSKARHDRYATNGYVDLGAPLFQGLGLAARGAWLIVLAIGFFVLYWLAAGPGTYAYLMAKRRQAMSWFLFAVAALIGTAVTVGVVRLVLRGPPVVKHLSVVRIAPGQPAMVFSRFGLYIPRDGTQHVELSDTMTGHLSYLAGMAEHPQQLGDQGEAPAPLDYDVPVRDLSTADTPALDVEYRSSLKAFQARWVGDLPATKINGSLVLDPTDDKLPIKGVLTNDTGMDLTDVYLAFHVTGDKDWAVYLPTWAKATPLDLQRDLRPSLKFVGHDQANRALPGQGVPLSDELAPPLSRLSDRQHGWQNCWYDQLRGAGGNGGDVERLDRPLSLVFPLMSVLDRMPPMPNLPSKTQGNPPEQTRVDLLARGGRMLDAGPSLSAGQLLVMTVVHGPLPIPVRVDGDRMAGDGTTLYQFFLPIDRSAVEKPTTKPSAER